VVAMLFPAARKKLKEEFLKNSKVSDKVRVDQVSSGCGCVTS
jgi:hypothetical protein